MRASLKDIAAALNISMTTVSWVLSGKGDEKNISKVTQQRIMECAEQMDYQPNLLARSLHTGVSHTLGLVMPSIRDRFFSQIAESVELAAEKAGYALMVCNTHGTIAGEERVIGTLRSRQVDGIVMAPVQSVSPAINRLIHDDFPFVLFDSCLPDAATNYVVADNELSSCNLVLHLLHKGYRKIALFLTNPDLFTSIQREQGYHRAHLQEGIKVDSALKINIDFLRYEAHMREMLERLLLQRPDVDGFFFMSHILAETAILYMKSKGIDLSRYGMACIHEEDALCALNPRLNTSVMPVEEIGREAIRILLKDINRRQEGDSSVEPVKEGVMLLSELHLRG